MIEMVVFNLLEHVKIFFFKFIGWSVASIVSSFCVYTIMHVNWSNLTNLIQSQPYSYELIVLTVHKKIIRYKSCLHSYHANGAFNPIKTGKLCPKTSQRSAMHVCIFNYATIHVPIVYNIFFTTHLD